MCEATLYRQPIHGAKLTTIHLLARTLWVVQILLEILVYILNSTLRLVAVPLHSPIQLKITFFVGWKCLHIYTFLQPLFIFFSNLNYLNIRYIHGICQSTPWTSDHALTNLALAIMAAWYFQGDQVDCC
jgi:hypothetical protein